MTANGVCKAALVWVLAASFAVAQVAKTDRKAPRRGVTPLERSVLEALSVNPATAPYAIATDIRNGRLVLSGRVATSALHDMVVQTALAYTARLDDDLVIDTAETARAVAQSGSSAAASDISAQNTAAALAFPAVSTYSSPPYYYPPPLFGRLDEPFYGFEPPSISYPYWWGGLTEQRLAELRSAQQADLQAQQAADQPLNQAPAPATRSIDLDVDNQGVATLRGDVASEAERTAIEQRVRATEGVTDVDNQLRLVPQLAPAQEVAVPPPPRPGIPASPPKQDNVPAAKPDNPPAVKPASPPREEKPKQPEPPRLSVTVRDDTAYLEGKAGSLNDAMQIYLAAKRAEGVRAVDDHLVVTMPDERHPNPLLQAPSADVAEYLLGQIRKHATGHAAIDTVDVNGDRVQVHGHVADGVERERMEATLRSMAILRGFDIQPAFTIQGSDR